MTGPGPTRLVGTRAGTVRRSGNPPARRVFHTQALRLHMQVSIAYVIWSGVGTAAIALIGAAWLGEPLTLVKVAGIGLIIAGVVVLNLAAAGAPAAAGGAHRPPARSAAVDGTRDTAHLGLAARPPGAHRAKPGREAWRLR